MAFSPTPVKQFTSNTFTLLNDNDLIHSFVTFFSVKSLLFKRIILGLSSTNFSISGLAELLGILASLLQ